MGWNWQERPHQPGDGFTWYGLALLSLAIFAWQSGARPKLHPLHSIVQWLRMHWARGLMLLAGLLLSWIAWLSVGAAPRPARSPVGALLLWIAGIGLATLALWLGRSGGRRTGLMGIKKPLPNYRWEIPAVALLVLAAFVLRFAKLNTIPYVLAGDEANMGHEAARVLAGELTNPFITGWLSHPTLFFFIQALPLQLFGRTPFAVRFLSPFVGALTVLATYWFARSAWGRPVAWVAAGLLAGYHFHLHYSRLSLNNIWDPLFALLVMGLLWRGWQSGERRYFVMSGLCLGLGQYFYMGTRVLLVMVATLALYWLLANWRKTWGQRSNLAAFVLIALVVVLPITLYALQHPDDYMARMNQLGIFQSGWLAREVELSGRSVTQLLGEQLWKSALAFNYTLDPAFFYRPGIPLLRFWPSILFVFGLGVALVRITKTPNFLLLLWIGGTVLFAGVLLENPPSSQRYVIAAPAVCILAALAMVWIEERLRRLLGGRREVWLGGVLLLTLWMVWGDLSFYFGNYTPNGDYGGLNTEVAHRVADYLGDLEPGCQVYFFGHPRMNISPQWGFPSVHFLAPEVDSVDVLEPLSAISELPNLQPPAVFIFLPERAHEMGMVRAVFPAGTEKHFPGRHGRILFISYQAP